MLEQLLNTICESRVGIEIGGPSASGNFIYEKSKSIDNVVFSNDTIWYKQQEVYSYYPGKSGKVIINDSVDICDIKSETYEFVFSSHCLEHIANPLKAVSEWLRITNVGGYLIIIVPEKSQCFDHMRQTSSFSTLLSQYQKNVGEDDLSTLPEILKNHDLSMDTAAGSFENFTRRSLDNINNRCLHHYVYSPELLKEICSHFNSEFIYTITQGLNIWFIMKKT